VLPKLSPKDLPKVLDLAISGRSNQALVRRSLLRICADKSLDLTAFRGSLCAALAQSIAASCNEEAIESSKNYIKVRRLLAIAHAVVGGLARNGASEWHNELDPILKVSLGFISMLSAYKKKQNEPGDSATSEDDPNKVEARYRWLELNSLSFGRAICVLRDKRYLPDDDTISEIKRRVEESTTNHSGDKSAGYLTNPLEADNLLNTLRLTATVATLGYLSGQERSVAALAQICTSIIDSAQVRPPRGVLQDEWVAVAVRCRLDEHKEAAKLARSDLASGRHSEQFIRFSARKVGMIWNVSAREQLKAILDEIREP